MEKTKSKPRWRLNMRHREMATGYFFILPVIIGLVFFFFPMLMRVAQYSVSDIEIVLGERYTLVPRGMYHYNHALFVHPTFVRSVAEMVTDMLWNVPLIIFFSLFMAILLNREFPGRLMVRAVFFLPVVLAVPAIQATLNMVMIMMADGMVDMGAETASGADSYFSAASLAMIFVDFGVPHNIIDFIVGTMGRLHTIIRSSGVQILIFLAALQAIPRSMYEAAQVEGTTAYESFWKITLPIISPMIVTNMVYTIVDIYIESAPVANARGLAFGGWTTPNFGLSSVMSFITIIVVTLLILISGFIVSRKVVYLT